MMSLTRSSLTVPLRASQPLSEKTGARKPELPNSLNGMSLESESMVGWEAMIVGKGLDDKKSGS
jgi:hypothetical protein